MIRAAVTVIGETSAGTRLTVLPGGTPLEGLGGALQSVAPLAQGILAVVDPSFHMWREHLEANQASKLISSAAPQSHEQTEGALRLL